jgi:polysaccharide pyruvyl transferase WcaK-like protein
MDAAPPATVSRALTALGLAPGEAFCVAGPSAVVDDLMSAGATPDAYSRLMARVVDELVELSEARVLLLPHARATVRNRQDDPKVCEDVLQLARHRDRVIVARDRYPAPLLKGMVSRAEVAVGSRFHFIVAALGAEVPALAIGWSHKYREMMSMLGQEEFAVGYEAAADAAVLVRVRDLWNKRAAIRLRLAEVLPFVRREASRNAEVVLNAVKQT